MAEVGCETPPWLVEEIERQCARSERLFNDPNRPKVTPSPVEERLTYDEERAERFECQRYPLWGY